MSADMTREDMAVIAMLWLVLCNMGYDIQDTDLNNPGYIKRAGPHTIYTFSILLRDDEVFQKGFGRLICNRIKKSLNFLEYKNFQWNSRMHSCKCEYGYSTGKH